MIGLLKRLARNSFLAGAVRRARIKKDVRAWTAHDDGMLAFYSRFFQPGDTVFDVGANVGNRVKVFLKGGAKVVAVEPQRECGRLLKSLFGGNPSFRLVPSAMGETVGTAEIAIADASTVSSMSPEWVDSVKATGRFGDNRWTRKETVPVSTLDRLIADHGIPAFIKIDVEGYELPVVKGLTRPVKALSLEFTPEFLDSTVKCVEHLQSLGGIEVNYSLYESMRFARAEWGGPAEVLAELQAFRTDPVLVGDVYVRFTA